MQQKTLIISDILQILHDGGRIDRFKTGNVFLINIFGEILSFDLPSFKLLIEKKFILQVHLHYPCAECFKISEQGLAYIHIKNPEETCPIPV